MENDVDNCQTHHHILILILHFQLSIFTFHFQFPIVHVISNVVREKSMIAKNLMHNIYQLLSVFLDDFTMLASSFMSSTFSG